MSENKNTQSSDISKARTPEEIGEFWDTHSLDEFWEETREVEFDVRAARKRRVALDPKIYQQIEVEARSRGIITERLVNLWLAEKLETTK